MSRNGEYRPRIIARSNHHAHHAYDCDGDGHGHGCGHGYGHGGGGGGAGHARVFDDAGGRPHRRWQKFGQFCLRPVPHGTAVTLRSAAR